MSDRILLAAGLVVIVVLATVSATLSCTYLLGHTSGCYEDEVAVWTGEGHDGCVAVDDLYEAHDGRMTYNMSDVREVGR